VTVALIAAVARDGVIGRAGGIPWHLPEDVARFKALTTGHAVVMGRKTWDSLPDRYRPLPERRNVVVTRTPDWAADGAERVGSFSEALELLADEERVYVIGGSEIYAAALTFADELELTEVELTVDGDTFFPAWERRAFDVVEREEHIAADGTGFAFVTYRRWGAGEAGQLAALAEVAGQLDQDGVAYWLFGGWAVDFHAGRVTRPHDDIDLAIWLDDEPRIAALLAAGGWTHAPEEDEDGGTGYERGGVRLELTYLVRRPDGGIVVPLRDHDAPWPDGAFGKDVRSLAGVSAHVIALHALKEGKSSARDDAGAAAKDRADLDVLSGS
jgi:dihydrofolate reductase